MTRDDVECRVDGDDLRCEVDGDEVQLQSGHREVVEDAFGDAADLQSCARMNEAFLGEFAHGEETERREALGNAMLVNGCPTPTFRDDQQTIEDNDD